MDLSMHPPRFPSAVRHEKNRVTPIRDKSALGFRRSRNESEFHPCLEPGGLSPMMKQPQILTDETQMQNESVSICVSSVAPSSLAREALLRLVLKKLVFNRIDQGEPAGFDDVLAHADGAPDIVMIGRFDDHPDAGRRASFAVHDADFVIDQPHFAKAGKITV